MNYPVNNSLYENISHHTDTSPFSIHHTIVSPGAESALYLHWHDEIEFLLLIQGELSFHIEDKTIHLHEGESIFIPPGLLHSASCHNNMAPVFKAFVFSPELLFSLFDTYHYNKYILPVLHNNLTLSTTLTPSIHWQKRILELLSTIFNATEQDELMIRGLSLLIWKELFKHHIAPNTNHTSLPQHMKQLQPAIDYLQENYAGNITLDTLSQCAHLSEGQFCRSFKNLTGMSPFHYLIRYRILQSCKELLQTERKITDIALSCGFNNISYYNRAFLKTMNMTPGEYRKTGTYI